MENNYSKIPLSDIHNTRNIHILDLICFFRPLGSMRGSGFPKERLYWGALLTLPLHLHLDIHFTFTTCLANQIKISDSESADAFFISWCQGVKLSWPLPVWSHRHLSVRRMAISRLWWWGCFCWWLWWWSCLWRNCRTYGFGAVATSMLAYRMYPIIWM